MTVPSSSGCTCLWRIPKVAKIKDLPGLNISGAMRDFIVLLVHLAATLIRLAKPGGLCSVVAESVLLRHQLLILNRGRNGPRQIWACRESAQEIRDGQLHRLPRRKHSLCR